MSGQDFAALLVAITTVLGGLTAMINFIVKHYLSELKPNSGSSMKDQMTRLEQRVDELFIVITRKQNFLMARKTKVVDDTYSALETWCISLNEYYKALRKAGFATDIAMALIMDRDSYPDWILPQIPNTIDPSEFEDED